MFQASDLYAGGHRLLSRPGHRLFLYNFFMVFSVRPANIGPVPHGRILRNF